MPSNETIRRRTAARRAEEQAKKNKEADEVELGGSSTFTFANFKNRTGAPGSNLHYPSELATSKGKTDYIRFRFRDYVPPYGAGSGDAGRGAGGARGYNYSVDQALTEPAKDASGNILKDIVLYMPEDVQAEYGTQWGPQSFQNITATAISGLGNAGQIFKNPGQAIQKAAQGAQKAGSDLALVQSARAALSAAQKLGQFQGVDVNDLYASTAGVVVNPNVELLFSGFDLRTINLNFKMTPRSAPEARAIRDIITTFKMCMLPTFKVTGALGQSITGGTFIKVPSLVDMKFMSGSDEHPYLSQYKPCAITGFNVNYTADGSYATFDNTSPVATTLSISLSETKLVYKEDIKWGGPSY